MKTFRDNYHKNRLKEMHSIFKLGSFTRMDDSQEGHSRSQSEVELLLQGFGRLCVVVYKCITIISNTNLPVHCFKNWR